jgi:hypothetical protein
MAAGRMPHEHDPSEVERILLRDTPELIDRSADVKVGLRPSATGLSKATILDVPGRDAFGFERVTHLCQVPRGGICGLEAPAVNEHDDRMWAGTGW